MSGGELVSGGVLAAVVLSVAVVAAVRGTWSPCGLSMISAINPLSERARGHRYWLTALWFVVGAVIGGAALGLVGALGALVVPALGVMPSVAAAVAAMCCLLTWAADSRTVPFRLPLIPRQVNERWLSGYRRWAYAGGFGAQIGVGVATYVMTAAVYLVPLLGALSGSPQFAMACGLTFGLVRGLTILLTARVRTTAGLRGLHRRLAALEPWSLRASMLVQAVAALAFCWFLGGWPAVLTDAAVVGVTVVGFALRTRQREAVGRQLRPASPAAFQSAR